MFKRLPVLSLLILLFCATVHAQTHADSTKNLPADSITKVVLVDTVIKKDTASLRTKTDTTIKNVAIVRPPVDSAMRKPVIDSVAKNVVVARPIADSAIRIHKTDSATTVKPTPVKTGSRSAKVKTTPLPADKVVKHSTVRSLTDDQYNALLRGDDMDSMSMVGVINHYPLPDQALKYKTQIGLNPGQVTKLKAMATELHRKKVEMGESIIRNEKMLDSLFHGHMVVDGTLIFYTNRAGLYYGELKGAILLACYRTEQLLSDDQIRKLEALLKAH